MQIKTTPPVWKVIAAFAAVYIIWGSTYLGIRIAIETIPPFVMLVVRFIIAGGLMYAWTAFQGDKRPSFAEWRSTFIVGSLLLMGGNGYVTFGEKYVPSGAAALLVAIMPLWMVLLNWFFYARQRPAWQVFLGVLVGFFGLVLLVTSGGTQDGGVTTPIGILSLLLGPFWWANGILLARHLPMPASPLRATAMEMLGAAAALFVVSLFTGDWVGFNAGAVSVQSWLALAYLVVFGSILAFTAFVWLNKVVTPAQLSTYSYINPVVAVFLGGLLLNETITITTLIASAVIVLAVVIITTYRDRKPTAAVGK